jgi:hypothetical protein
VTPFNLCEIINRQSGLRNALQNLFKCVEFCSNSVFFLMSANYNHSHHSKQQRKNQTKTKQKQSFEFHHDIPTQTHTNTFLPSIPLEQAVNDLAQLATENGSK